MKYLLLFTALIATANALQCQCSQCGADKTCTKEPGKCYSIEREIAIEKNKSVKESIKGCLNDKEASDICKQEFILMSSDQDFYLMSSVKCCDKDECNKDSPALNKTLPSGDLVCPSCFVLDKKPCEGKSMRCGNLQKKCFTMDGTINKTDKVQDFNAKGCAVENTIFKQNFSLSSEDTTYKLNNVQFLEGKIEKPKDEKPKDEKPKDGASQISSCLSFAILLPSVLWFLLDSSLY